MRLDFVILRLWLLIYTIFLWNSDTMLSHGFFHVHGREVGEEMDQQIIEKAKSLDWSQYS